MPRVFIISIIILGLLVGLGIMAKQANLKTISTAFFAAAGVYVLILLGGFFGLIGEW